MIDSGRDSLHPSFSKVLEESDFQEWMDEAADEKDKDERVAKVKEIVKESADAFELMEKASNDYERNFEVR